jgi:Domain of unknown function (DUF4034)
MVTPRLRLLAQGVAAVSAALTLAACVTRANGYEGTAGAATAAVKAPPAAADPQEPFKDDVRALLRQEQFEALDRLAAELVKTRARFAGGDWKSYRFQEAIHGPAGGDNASDEEWERHIAVLQRWHAARPDSIAAVIALTESMANFGWKARGNGYAGTVTPEGWRLLHERTAGIDGLLIPIGDRVPRTPDWYRAMIDTGRIEGWDRDRVDALVDEAIALEPKYLHVYSAMARYLMPRWQGEDGDWEAFAERSAERLGGQEGSVVYGHVAWQISKFYRGADFYKQNRVSWPRVEQGFVDREALYGSSVRTLNAFCELAGSAADRARTRELFARIGDQWDAEVWKDWKYFDGYRAWAGR